VDPAVLRGVRMITQRADRMIIKRLVRCCLVGPTTSIGIGGHLAMPPLPHHQAYGSVPWRFGGLSIHQLLHWGQAQTTETGFGEAPVQSF
jgi:hypothetical protein